MQLVKQSNNTVWSNTKHNLHCYLYIHLASIIIGVRQTKNHRFNYCEDPFKAI